jgi:hypothetical protein
MKINLAENLLRFGAKNLSEESRKKLSEQPVQNLGTVNVTATNPMGAKFAMQNKGKSFGALPINGKPAYFYTIPRTGEQAQPVNLIVADILYSAPSTDAKYNPRTKQTTASQGSLVFILNSPGYVEDLRLSVSSDGSAKIVGQPKLGKIQYNLYDANGNALLANQSDVNKFINTLNVGLVNSFANAKQVNPMIAGAATVLASTKDTKPGAGTKRG